MTRHIRRRKFLQHLSSGAAGLGAAGFAAIGAARSAAAFAVNETVRIGCIGTGGRSLHALMPSAKAVPGVKLAAVCDVWDQRIADAKKIAEPDAFATRDYRAVLDRKDIDVVIVATPDHWHVPVTVDACKAEKDVYVEKPLTHKLVEGQAVIDAQNEHRRIVQVGMQQRSMPQFIEAYEQVIQRGVLGKIHKVHLTWNRNADVSGRRVQGIDPRAVDWKRFLGNAPEQPFDEYRFRNWRWFWDFGGGILTDLMVHFIDVANWYCGLDHPASASAIGDVFRAKGAWETPDTIQTLLHYPEQEVQLYFEGTFVNARNRAMLEFMGTEATLYLDRGRYEVHPESDRFKKVEKDFGGGVRGADFSNINCGLLHIENWIDCVRSRKKPRAPAEEGVRAVFGAHLGNRAYRTGQVARWEA
jgi:predicted dehydrogenase